MTDGGRPPAVRRFLRRPAAWVIVVAIALPVLAALDERNREEKHPASGDAITVEGVAGEASYGGVDVTYHNPVTDQEVETFVGFGGKVPEPAAGSKVSLVVNRDDPEDLRLLGDEVPETLDVLAMVLIAGTAVGWFGLRWGAVRRAERLAAAPGPAFAMIGGLRPRRLARRPSLHLWALDAPPGAEALCAVPVLSTAGLPVGGAAFPVEVKGSPRNLGRVVARCGSTMLWPSARCLLAASAPRPNDVLSADQAARTAAWGAAGHVDGSRHAATPAALDRGRFIQALLGTNRVLVVMLTAALGILTAVAGVTAVHATAATELEREGVTVIAEVKERKATTVTVSYRLPGDTEPRSGSVPVDFPEDQKLGLRLPAYVDPEEPDRLRFLRDPYDAREPVLWAAWPVAALIWLLVRRYRIWAAAERLAAHGMWRATRGLRVATDRGLIIALGSPEAGVPSAAELRVSSDEGWRLMAAQADGTFDLEIAGDTDPGGVVALRQDGRPLQCAGRTRCPRPPRRRGRRS